MPKVYLGKKLSRPELRCLLKSSYVVMVEEPAANMCDVLFNLDFDDQDMQFEIYLGFMENLGGEVSREVLFSFTHDELLRADVSQDGCSLRLGSGGNEILLTFMMPVRLRPRSDD